MPSNTLTLLDLMKIKHGADPYMEIVNEIVTMIPEVTGNSFDTTTGQTRRVGNVGAGRTIPGQTFPSLVRNKLPSVGFRDFNDGSDYDKGDFTERLFQCKLLNPKWGVDRALEFRPEFAERMAEESFMQTEAALKTLGVQFYYGTLDGVGDAKGHPGLIDFVPAGNVIDAGGSTALTSVWAVKFGMGHVEWLYGNGLSDLRPTDVRYGDMTGGNGKTFTAAIHEAYLFPGLKVSSTFSVGRIKKIGTAAGKKLTIARMNALWDTFTANGVIPDAFFMTVRSQRQLTDDHITPENKKPALITDWNSVPIVITNSISESE